MLMTYLVLYQMTADERKKYDTVKSKLEGHFIIKRNVIFERAKFNLRFQKENESVDNFITDLFTLAQHCNYGTLQDEMVRDRIVVGLKDKTLSEKLQLEADLTLEKAINQARQKELVRQPQGIIRQEGPSASNVDRVKSTKLTANQKCIHNEIYVVKGLERPLLSRYASQSLNLINKVDAISSEEYKNNIVNQYPDLFKGLGEIEGEYKINLVENSTPFALTTPRKVPLPLLSKTKKEIECLKWG